MEKHENVARQFVGAIKAISAKPDNLDNLECYLTHHFEEWLKLYACTPKDLTAELRAFAEMEI